MIMAKNWTTPRLSPTSTGAGVGGMTVASVMSIAGCITGSTELIIY